MNALRAALLASAAVLIGCGGGGGGGETGDDGTTFKGLLSPGELPGVTVTTAGATTTLTPVADDSQRLTAAEVNQVLADAVAEATARGVAATIAVTDRVGNVLAVWQMPGADKTLLAEARGAIADGSGLDGLFLPDVGAATDGGPAAVGAIAKAVTGAYLSSAGNAFTTRTASQIVQENFNPLELRQFGGPLFGVQFSQLPCSDLSVTFPGGGRVGPQRSPLGLAADPGGLPLYKNGFTVGGVGVIADGRYGLDLDLRDVESEAANVDELIALAASRRFLPPAAIEAPQITVEGKTLRFTDQGLANDLPKLRSAQGGATPSTGAFVDVRGYFDRAGGALAGTTYGAPDSGYVAASTLPADPVQFFEGQSAYVLVDAAGARRFPLRAGGDGAGALSVDEVRQVIDEGLGVALAGRGQIRRPIESPIHVTVTVVNRRGEVLGLARTPDGPIFGTDVALQKARSALFFSDPAALAQLNTVGQIVGPTDLGVLPGGIPDPSGGPGQFVTLRSMADYLADADAFVGGALLRPGGTVFSNRGIGNLARPFYPDGVNGNPNGPLSRPFGGADTSQNWSPFSTGIQFDLIGANVLQHVLFVLLGPGVIADTPQACTLLPPSPGAGAPILANGLQIFAGSVPIYRNGVLVGAVGVSGDGIDQDDMIAALGLARAGAALPGSGLANGPAAIRSDTLSPLGSRLRYVSCPFGPFRGSDAQNVCEAL